MCCSSSNLNKIAWTGLIIINADHQTATMRGIFGSNYGDNYTRPSTNRVEPSIDSFEKWQIHCMPEQTNMFEWDRCIVTLTHLIQTCKTECVQIISHFTNVDPCSTARKIETEVALQIYETAHSESAWIVVDIHKYAVLEIQLMSYSSVWQWTGTIHICRRRKFRMTVSVCLCYNYVANKISVRQLESVGQPYAVAVVRGLCFFSLSISVDSTLCRIVN